MIAAWRVFVSGISDRDGGLINKDGLEVGDGQAPSLAALARQSLCSVVGLPVKGPYLPLSPLPLVALR